MKGEKKSCAICVHSIDLKLDSKLLVCANPQNSKLLVCAHPQKVKKDHILFGSKDFKCSKWEGKPENED